MGNTPVTTRGYNSMTYRTRSKGSKTELNKPKNTTPKLRGPTNYAQFRMLVELRKTSASAQKQAKVVKGHQANTKYSLDAPMTESEAMKAFQAKRENYK